MNQSDNTPTLDRLYACLVYLLPLLDGVSFGAFFFKALHLDSVFFLLLGIYGSLPLQPFTGLIVFFVLLLAVVRRENIPHFIRFNTMQALLLDIVLMLCGLILDVLRSIIASGLFVETLYNTVFLGLVAAIGYCVVQSIRGQYAEIPAISDAVKMQVR